MSQWIVLTQAQANSLVSLANSKFGYPNKNAKRYTDLEKHPTLAQYAVLIEDRFLPHLTPTQISLLQDLSAIKALGFIPEVTIPRPGVIQEPLPVPVSTFRKKKNAKLIALAISVAVVGAALAQYVAHWF